MAGMVSREFSIRFLILAALTFAMTYAFDPSLVQAQVLESIAVTPANPSVAVGLGQQFTATGTYSDGSTQNLTNSVTWSSTYTTAATITLGLGLWCGRRQHDDSGDGRLGHWLDYADGYGVGAGRVVEV